MAEKTLNQFTLATAKPGLTSLLFARDPVLTAPQSRAFVFHRAMETIQDGLTVKSLAVSDPTALTPAVGDTYVVNPTGAGGWVSQDNNIATWDGSAWVFATPAAGWRVGDQNTKKPYEFTGTVWALRASDTVSFDNTVSGLAATDVKGAIDELAAEKFDHAMTVNAQTGTAYTMVIADASAFITMDNAAANTLTIPTNATVAFPVGTWFETMQLGAGATSVAGDTGVTLNGVSAGSGAMAGAYQASRAFKIATDEWVIYGDIGVVA